MAAALASYFLAVSFIQIVLAGKLLIEPRRLRGASLLGALFLLNGVISTSYAVANVSSSPEPWATIGLFADLPTAPLILAFVGVTAFPRSSERLVWGGVGAWAALSWAEQTFTPGGGTRPFQILSQTTMVFLSYGAVLALSTRRLRRMHASDDRDQLLLFAFVPRGMEFAVSYIAVLPGLPTSLQGGSLASGVLNITQVPALGALILLGGFATVVAVAGLRREGPSSKWRLPAWITLGGLAYGVVIAYLFRAEAGPVFRIYATTLTLFVVRPLLGLFALGSRASAMAVVGVAAGAAVLHLMLRAFFQPAEVPPGGVVLLSLAIALVVYPLATMSVRKEHADPLGREPAKSLAREPADPRAKRLQTLAYPQRVLLCLLDSSPSTHRGPFQHSTRGISEFTHIPYARVSSEIKRLNGRARALVAELNPKSASVSFPGMTMRLVEEGRGQVAGLRSPIAKFYWLSPVGIEIAETVRGRAGLGGESPETIRRLLQESGPSVRRPADAEKPSGADSA